MKKANRLFNTIILLAAGSLLACNITFAADNRENVRIAFTTFCDAIVIIDSNIPPTELQSQCIAIDALGLPSSIMTQITSEQTAAQKSVALEMNNAQTNSINNRMTAVRSGQQAGGLKVSGLFYEQNGNQLSASQLTKLNSGINKTAAGDDIFDRLGIFVNANIGFGDRETTSNETGYNLDSHGTTIGIDYRFTDNFLLGTAFSFNNATSRYSNSLGELESDSFGGAIYATFFTEQGFFVDGFFSGSHIDYDSRRQIRFTTGAGTVNANANGENSGYAFNVAMTSGYNFNFAGLKVTPLVRVDYIANQVESLNEKSGQGLALHVEEQDFDSLQTAAGVQFSYAISLPWAVISPMVQAEYIHEFKNDARNISAYFLQDPTRTRFNIGTDSPDRDYITMSAGISAQFIHGFSAFVSYDTVQAHSFVDNHNFTGGLRIELPF